MSEVALQLTEPLTDRRVFRQKRARGLEGRHGFVRPSQPQTQIGVGDRELSATRIVRPALANDRERGLWSLGRETRIGPPGPRFFEERRTPRGLLEMRGRAIETLEAHQRSGEIHMTLEALDAAGDQLLERALGRRVLASIQRENPVAHEVVRMTELEDLVFRIGARCGRGRPVAAHVPERAEPLERLGRQRSRLGRGGLRRDAAFLLEQPGERRSQSGGLCRLFFHDVAPFMRIRRKVVELGSRGQHVLPRSSPEDAQIAPAEMEQRHQRLGILRAGARLSPRASQRGGEAVA